ncbi:MAG: amino acid aminotransferase [Chloroflexota bacterium]
MFNQLEMAPPDPILGLAEAFKKDPSTKKINLSVGVYQNEKGVTPIFRSVKSAEEMILEQETSKGYLPIDGAAEYARAVQAMVFGADSELPVSGRVVTAHTPGGTGGLRVAADFLAKIGFGGTVWLSTPTWPNHPNIFRVAGLKVDSYPYFDAANNGLNFDAMLAAVEQMPQGDVILLHGSCHNPTGSDPSREQWTRLAEAVATRGLLPLIDFAYQGLGNGLEEDAFGVRTLAGRVPEAIVVSSFSKNFGLYNERTGALSLVAGSGEAADKALSHIKTCVRVNYSNPPAHGGKIVTTILSDARLRAEWQAEVEAMCARIRSVRRQFVAGLAAEGVQRDFSFIERQNGMFSFTGLSKEQVQRLRQEHAVYIVETGGRINVAGINEGNLQTLCQAIAAVL